MFAIQTLPTGENFKSLCRIWRITENAESRQMSFMQLSAVVE